jgi:hypothetical protein
MLSIEEKHYPLPGDYLLKLGTKEEINSHATASWRRRLCEWMFEVTDHFGFDREVVSVASYLMDRSGFDTFQKGGRHATKREYQLTAVAALYTALKVHGEMDPEVEQFRIKLKLSQFVELSRGFFTEETIQAKEAEILNQVGWHINPPTPTAFLSLMLEQLPDWFDANDDENMTSPRSVIHAQLFDVAKYLTELAVFIPELAFEQHSSTVSYAALLCALDHVDENYSFPHDVQATFLELLTPFCYDYDPQLLEIQDMQAQLKKLAPDFFPEVSDENSRRLTRTVSLVDVESVDRPTATSNNDKRAISPNCVSKAAAASSEPSRKRQRMAARSEGPLPDDRFDEPRGNNKRRRRCKTGHS